MQSYLTAGEEHLIHAIKNIYNTPVGWWVIIYQPKGAAALHIAENGAQLELTANIIENEIESSNNMSFYVGTNGAFILLGKGARSQKLTKLEDQFKTLFQTAEEGVVAPIGDLEFEMSFYDLSAQLTGFIKHMTFILAECERIKDERRAEAATLRQNLFPVIGANKAEDMQRARAGRKNLHVMFIEDDRPTLSLLRQLMLGIDNTHHVITAENGEKGMRIYFEEAPDVLFLDVNLPDMTGLEILEFIRANDKQSHVIMLTAEASETVVRSALTLGTKGFVRKPFSRKQFQTVLETFLQAREQKQAT